MPIHKSIDLWTWDICFTIGVYTCKFFEDLINYFYKKKKSLDLFTFLLKLFMPLVLFLYVSIVVMFCGYKVIYGNLWYAALLDAIREDVSVLTLLAEVLCLLDMIVNSFAHTISTKPVDRYTRPEFTG